MLGELLGKGSVRGGNWVWDGMSALSGSCPLFLFFRIQQAQAETGSGGTSWSCWLCLPLLLEQPCRDRSIPQDALPQFLSLLI